MDKREQRRSIAHETVHIVREGKYTIDGAFVDISQDIEYSNANSIFVSQREADRLEKSLASSTSTSNIELRNESTLAAIIRLKKRERNQIGVLNFASAKNPGGGFLNGAMAQEESLAAASGLYDTLLQRPAYYESNKACHSFCYTDCAIWSPDVVFFREDAGKLLCIPAKASVLTLPAVNYGQVLLKGENAMQAKAAMKRRMKIALSIFADKHCKTIILGAYGCGVFLNDPADVATWWDELLTEYSGHFDKVVFAVLDRTKTQDTISAFAGKWGVQDE